jgi:MFS family permease
MIGLLITWLFVKDTGGFVATEALTASSAIPRLKNIFIETSFTNNNLSSVTQAGLINNLNDGMIWGLLPILLSQKHFSLLDIGVISSIYPAVWGLSQIITGKLADHISKKLLLFWGMLLQAIAIAYLIFAASFFQMVLVAIFLGIGTAMVYPTFLATISDHTHVHDRAKSLGIFRFWRDSGYAIGAIITGLTADYFGATTSILIIAILTLFSAIFIKIRMD